MIDTCIIIDFLQNREPFADNAQRIIELSLDKAFDAFISAKSVTDINYVIKKSASTSVATNLLTGYIWQICEVLDTVQSDVFNALFSQMTDYEDATLVETSKRNHLDAVVTRNKKDFENADIKVYFPEEFINLFTKSSRSKVSEISI